MLSDTMMVCTHITRSQSKAYDISIIMNPSSWSDSYSSSGNTFDSVSIGAIPTVTAAVWPAAGSRKTAGNAFTVTIYGTNLAGSSVRTIPPVLRFGGWPCFGPYQYSHTGAGSLQSAETYIGSATMMTCVMGPGTGNNLALTFNFKWSTFDTGTVTFLRFQSPRKVYTSDISLTIQV